MKTGLILEGGAMRGLFTAGVLDVMMENGVTFDGLIGVSAGAAFGSNYKSRQIGRTLRYNVKYCRDPRYCGVRSLLKTGDIYGVDFCYRQLPFELDAVDTEAFNRSSMEFHVGATDVETGKPVYHRCDRIDTETLDWIRASASMPFVSRVVEIGEQKLLDGGVSDSIPIAYFESLGYDHNVVILTQPRGFVKKRIRAGALVRMALRKHPRTADAMLNRHVFYNETLDYIAEKEARGELIAIRPDAPLPIGHISHNAQKLENVYRIGRAVGERRLAEIQAFLATDPCGVNKV